MADAKSRADALLQMMKQGSAAQKRPAEPPSTTEKTETTEKIEKEEDKEKEKETPEDVKSEKDDAGPSSPKKIRTEEKDDFETLDSLPRIQIHLIQSPEGCIHECAVPPHAEYKPLMKSQTPPAKEYPFQLDPFQREALLCLDNYQSVLVSAHTSAGKTVVALYAIAMSLRDKQRVIYTSPIKALSNQKYRELYEEFQDVGLMTGDVTINPSASCLVMTTEILRSMLYRGSEIMREVGWVIFDEIHYMRDKERGVVWEEAIILLPDNVHYVFLSATIPNARQFAEWIVFLHDQPCHVVYTDYRPVPLQHYIYPAGGDGIHMVVNEKGDFTETGFNNAMAVLKNAGEAGQGDKRGRRGGTVGDSNVYKIITMCMENRMAPVIVFSFSRRDCEAYATSLKNLEFTDSKEKELIDEVYTNAMDVLSESDRQLQQIVALKEFLKRGIGIHHSGLLPILKETVEILFSEGLLKVLFATETFSMGLNMPAKTVLFSSARKFDGKDYRWISSGEYVQMSGRAGRRGLDQRGICILIVDQHMGADAAKQIIKGNPDPLNSQFRLTYNMVLNLLRVEGINPEFMLERSFYQFQNYGSLPGLYEKVGALEEKYQNIKVPNELETVGYYKIKQEIASLGRELQKLITKPIYIVPFLQPGRLIKVKHHEEDFGWGIVVSFEKKIDKEDPIKTDPVYVVQALLHLNKETKHISQIRPCPPGEKGIMEVVPIMLNLISEISAIRVFYPDDLRPMDNRMSVLRRIEEVMKKFPSGPPLLDPVEDLKIKEPHLKDLVKKIEAYQERLANHPLRKNPNLMEICKIYEEKLQVEKELKAAKEELKKAKSLLQLEELKCRKRVLRRLGYCDQQDVITQKGRVACEISAADELLLTEMLFNGMFNGLTPQLAAALLSCFTFQENAEMPRLADELSGILQQMQDTAKRIAKVQMEAKMPDFEEDAYVDSFKPHMMDVVHAWAGGATFAKIMEKTPVFEGSIIRCMRRLEELMREMTAAARSMGNTDLENMFAEGIRLIKRDIIFAASLYL